ncbi:vWA domain-containing protein [Plebeiibacterium marinum]|uniref:VWA domain-containing protein n=1 Tax=Plebeiibacterium marinum TaxID=2992111 RepID=A0AAE3MBS5_9BACT|nr:VWA domain-containing protein [Plebeiobacterium marinum]MCW3804881.1 VWA domain-containing protein [Plebeiobacterium marinum]
MFRFENPEYLYFLAIIPILAFLSLIIGKQRRKALEKFGNPELLDSLMPSASKTRPVIKFYIMLLAIACLIITMAGPQFGSKLETMKRKGIEIMIALDVSNSMNAQDIQPSRLDRAKRAIYQLVDKLNNDKVGLIVFAGQAYTQLPITTDYPSAKMFISSINTGIIPTQGTAIGAAIERGIRSFSSQEDINRAIIVITDGENHEDDAIAAAKAAVEKGIKVYTVGMGLPKGSPIPVPGGDSNNFMKDREGNVVISKLNEEMLIEIAKNGNGEFISANNIRKGINNLVDHLSKLEKTEMDAKVYTDFDHQFQYIALIALLLLLIDYMVLERKNKYFKNINLFEEKEEEAK